MIYLIADLEQMVCKIGYAGNPNHRIKQLQTGNANELILMQVIPGDKPKETELHNKFKEFRLKGEWFEFNNIIQNHFSYEYKLVYPEYEFNDTIISSSCTYYMKHNNINFESNTIPTLNALYLKGIFTKGTTMKGNKEITTFMIDPQINLKKHGLYPQYVVIDFMPHNEY